jgi:hypothetical protein
MTNYNPNQNGMQAQLAMFGKELDALRSTNRKLSPLVRDSFLKIEAAIKEGTPLEQIRRAFNASFGLDATMTAFKSALHRVRKDVVARRHLGIPMNVEIPSFVSGADAYPNAHKQGSPFSQEPSYPIAAERTSHDNGWLGQYQNTTVYRGQEQQHIGSQSSMGSNGSAPIWDRVQPQPYYFPQYPDSRFPAGFQGQKALIPNVRLRPAICQFSYCINLTLSLMGHSQEPLRAAAQLISSSKSAKDC